MWEDVDHEGRAGWMGEHVLQLPDKRQQAEGHEEKFPCKRMRESGGREFSGEIMKGTPKSRNELRSDCESSWNIVREMMGQTIREIGNFRDPDECVSGGGYAGITLEKQDYRYAY